MNLRYLRFAAIVIFIIFLPGFMTAGETEEKKVPVSGQNKVLIKFYSETTEETREAVRKRFGAEVIRHLQEISAEVWKLPEGITVEEVIRGLKKETAVEASEPDSLYKPGLIQSVPIQKDNNDIAKEPFHLENNGGLRCHGVNHFLCKNLTGNY
jgi:hypothetical protein